MARHRSFQYKTLLRIRKRQEELKAGTLAAARRETALVREERGAIEQEQRRVLSDAGQKMREHFDAADVRRYYQYERCLSRLIDDKDAVIRELDAKAEVCRAELEQATKEKKIVEKLKERRNAAFHKDQQRLEQLTTDEVANTYSARYPQRDTKRR